jgi:hypothetical protein
MKKSYNPEGFGARVSEEMERAGIKDVRTLHQKVNALTSERGTSYTAVFQYAKGTWPTEPRRPVVEALARVLNGVRPEYLLFDGEPRTEADMEAVRRGDARVSTERKGRDPEAEVFHEAFNPGPAAEAMLWRLWAPLFWKSSVEEPDAEQEAISVECARRIVRALLAPLEVLDAMPPRMEEPGRLVADSPDARRARMYSHRLDDYIIVVSEALRVIVQRQANAADEEAMNPDPEGDNGEA